MPLMTLFLPQPDKIREKSFQPLLQIGSNKFIIMQIRISIMHSGNFPGLSGGKHFCRIQTPDPFEQPLPPQNLVDTRNTSGKVVSRIKKRRIAISYLSCPGQHPGRNIFAAVDQ